MDFLLVVFTMYCFSTSFSNGLSTGGYYFVSNACYQNSVSLSAPKIELKGVEMLECGRLCATYESCKACHVFTHAATQEKICYLYSNNLCTTGIYMHQDLNISNGRLWDKISADNTLSVSPCRSDVDCTVSIANSVTTMNPEIFSTSLDTVNLTNANLTINPAGSTASYGTAGTGMMTNESETNTIFSNATTNFVVESSPAENSTSSSTTTALPTSTTEATTMNLPPSSPMAPTSSSSTQLIPRLGNMTENTGTSPTSSPMAPTSSSATPPTSTSTESTAATTSSSTTTALPTSTTAASTANLGEPRPRTCWDYYVQNGTNDTDYGTPRTIWPTGYSSGPNISAHCRNGYTVILINYAVIAFFYDNKNSVTVFGSAGKTISTSDTAGWKAYTSSINFPVLSDLVRSSNRTLYFEHTSDVAVQDGIGIYSGLDIAPDGTLSIQGPFKTIVGSPPNGFPTPLNNSLFVNSTCGSFWRIPETSTDICTQTTNMLLLAQHQKVGGISRRFVCLAFK